MRLDLTIPILSAESTLDWAILGETTTLLTLDVTGDPDLIVLAGWVRCTFEAITFGNGDMFLTTGDCCLLVLTTVL